MGVFLILAFLPYFQNDYGASSIGIGGGPITLNGKIEYISYNPASLAKINKTMVLLGMQNINGERYTVFDYDGDTVITYKQSEFLPNITGIAIPLNGKFSLGIIAAIPYRMQHLSEWEEERTVEEPEGSGIYYRWIESKKIYSLNIATACRYSDKLSLGLNLSFLYEIYNYGIECSENVDQVPNTSGILFGVETCFGFQFKINEYFALGSVVRKGILKGNHYFSYFNFEDGQPVEVRDRKSEKETLPFIIIAGFNIKFTDNLLLNQAIEFIRWEGAKNVLEEDPKPIDYYNPRNVWRFHEGIEYKMTSHFVLRLGFYTNPYPFRSPDSYWDQVFLTSGIGIKLSHFELDFSVAASDIIRSTLKKENQLFFTLSYK
jgi:long-subunit fatty acid transport protein